MATNDFVPFATGGGANVETQSAYLADSQLPTGNQPGVARSSFNNKALRQATSIASAVAQYAANVTGNNVLDDGNASTLLATITAAFSSNIPTIYELTGSGNFDVPVGTTYIKLKMVGAGASGSAYTTNGNNGGNTTFGNSGYLTAHGGTGANGNLNGGYGGAGGTGATLPMGVTGRIFKGGDGQSGDAVNAVPSDTAGGAGGVNPFGGSSSGQNAEQSPTPGADRTGAGGAGSVSADNGSTNYGSGGGGGAGEYIECVLSGSALSGLGSVIAYSCGVGGAALSVGTPLGTALASAGGSGSILLEVY